MHPTCPLVERTQIRYAVLPMARQPHNRPPIQPNSRAIKLPKQAAAPAIDEKTAARIAKLQPLTITEKTFVRSRPPLERSRWDKSLQRIRFVAPAKGEPIPSKVAENAVIETILPLRLGGLFHMQYVMLRQPQGFALQAVKGSFGVLGGMAESWLFEPFKGGTQVTLQRTLVPRFKPLRAYVERNHTKAMKAALEALKTFVEEPAK
jgi:hypothetical protein